MWASAALQVPQKQTKVWHNISRVDKLLALFSLLHCVQFIKNPWSNPRHICRSRQDLVAMFNRKGQTPKEPEPETYCVPGWNAVVSGLG
ncbi:hypothetical protein scyTo_0010082 [Scyliorhinus torazame]|uniref:Uncharacterized protein n=1 Tax=Scyliorhinus torazame TaxID=75743 RepID=A0A401NZF6_SCYTO|nr:hypothetical protein [Scyliorhinus torazame]